MRKSALGGVGVVAEVVLEGFDSDDFKFLSSQWGGFGGN